MLKGVKNMPATLDKTETKLRMFYDADIDRTKLLQKKIAVLGFGSQGYGQSANLFDSGANVKIALRPGSKSEAKAKAAGLETISIEDTVEWADLVVWLIPDVDH